jgi:hypothetical protein
MAAKKPRTRRIMEPHEANETTPCESCRKRAHELTAGQGHARNTVESLKRERELEAMRRRQPFQPDARPRNRVTGARAAARARGAGTGRSRDRGGRVGARQAPTSWSLPGRKSVHEEAVEKLKIHRLVDVAKHSMGSRRIFHVRRACRRHRDYGYPGILFPQERYQLPT